MLEGTVQRSGDRVRVNAQLIDARTDASSGAESYDREVADVFAIESELSEQIVAQLQAKLSPKKKQPSSRNQQLILRPTICTYAAKHSSRLLHLIRRCTKASSEAVRLLNQAIERDPAFALPITNSPTLMI